MKITPLGEAAQLRAIRALQAYRDDAEREYVQRRLAAITEELHARHIRFTPSNRRGRHIQVSLGYRVRGPGHWQTSTGLIPRDVSSRV